MKLCIGAGPMHNTLAGKVRKTRVRLGSNKSWQRVPQNTNDGLSAPLSITEF